MNEPTLQKIFTELEAALTGQKFGKIFLLSRYRFAFDFRLPDSLYLFISIEPTAPRIYLIRRRFGDLEKQNRNPTPFILLLRNRLSNAVLKSIEKIEDERILRLYFRGRNDVGQNVEYSLIAQLTGRSANLFLLDERGFIIDSCRENTGPGQMVAEKFGGPAVRLGEGETGRLGNRSVFERGEFSTLSEALDHYHLERETEAEFRNKAGTARNLIKREINKRRRLVKNLKKDLAGHGEADVWKRFGDLILANLATARRFGGRVLVTDFYDPDTPEIEIEIDENDSLNTAAEKFFKRYTKARNAYREISVRLKTVEAELAELLDRKTQIDEAIREKDSQFLAQFAEDKKKSVRGNSNDKKGGKFSGARKFSSSDGFEILVGRRSKDNDYLTFRIAKASDLWLHAADYPGSHVIIKNPNRAEIPHTTLLEAAQMAAFYSQARSEPKAAVHYTQKKFVNKPKGAVHGLVSLASFKTILVEPKVVSEQQ